MKAYLTSLITAALIAALVSILTPNGERGGIAGHQKLLTSLFLVCVLIAPLNGAIKGLQALIGGDLSFIETAPTEKNEYREQMNDAINSASERYFTQMLTQTISENFSIPTDELRCLVAWKKNEEDLAPDRVTVILTGSAIWKDPHAIEAFVTELLGCPCATAIE